jgi:hypothetical protein
MARTKKKDLEEDIEIEDLDLNQFGISEKDYLNFTGINQKANLKKLKKRLKNISEMMSITQSTLIQLICVLENCFTAKKLSTSNKNKIIELIKIFDDNLIDIVWNIDNIIEDAEYGDLFTSDCDLAEKKIIEIVSITKEIEILFSKLKQLENFDEGISKISFSVMGIIEIINQMQFLFQKIENIEKTL